MINFPYFFRIIIQFAGYDGKISVIERVFLCFFLIHYGYFDGLLFIQYLTGFFQDGFFFDAPVLSASDRDQ